MPDAYIDVPIEFDETVLYNRGITRIQSYFPNWSPKQGSMIDVVLRTCAMFAAVGAEVGSDVPFSIFRAFGPMAHTPPLNATPATIVSTWTAQDDVGGYLVPDQTPVGLTSAGATGSPVGFATLGDQVFPAGQATMNITLVAAIPGADTSGLDTVVRADSLAFVTNITVIGQSQDGLDAELDTDFVNRMSQEFETWSTTPLRGRDFAAVARQVVGVFRCAYWENYNPADGTTNNDKYVTLCPIDIAGVGVSAAVQTAVQTLVASLREVGFVAPVVSPNVSTIDVTGVVHTSDPNLQAQAIADATLAVQNYLNPATWGMPQTGTGQSPVWINVPMVRYSKVVTALEDVNNVDFADGVTIGLHGAAMGTSDIDMAGAFPLPAAGTITITAVTP